MGGRGRPLCRLGGGSEGVRAGVLNGEELCTELRDGSIECENRME